jgi:hypothetical protein
LTQEEFDIRLEKLALKKSDFIEIANQKKGTVYNWGTSRVIGGIKEVIAIPDWVAPFLDFYEKARKYEQIKKLLN